MTRLIAFTIIAAFALAAIYVGTHYSHPQNAGLPVVHASIPTANPEAVVIPWALNTRCRIDSRNLPPREERT